MTVEQAASADARVAPAWGEVRYGAELARLLADPRLSFPRRRRHAAPVLLVPGFMAGDASLAVMRAWLRRRGHRVAGSGMLANVDCAGRAAARLEARLADLVEECGRQAVLIGQSRGGALARALAVRRPDLVDGLVMLGSPVRAPLAVSAPVLRTVRWIARLGDLGVPGVLSTDCRHGDCCADFDAALTAPLADHVSAVAVYSRSDGVVDWRSCVDPYAHAVEVDSSHCGMSVHPGVYRQLERTLDRAAPQRAAA
jgi:pimeloyl-ACP methyl ester carboxylesterase